MLPQGTHFAVAGRGLTIRSTGHIVACRHLPRHFILGQMPSHHNVPVSSNYKGFPICQANQGLNLSRQR